MTIHSSRKPIIEVVVIHDDITLDHRVTVMAGNTVVYRSDPIEDLEYAKQRAAELTRRIRVKVANLPGFRPHGRSTTTIPADLGPEQSGRQP